jgi:hypothetical protein
MERKWLAGIMKETVYVASRLVAARRLNIVFHIVLTLTCIKFFEIIKPGIVLVCKKRKYVIKMPTMDIVSTW